ncbi:unknown [Prevotella sp. CAG:1124]|nr:unknown [Prevotella sp. CAG:1124]
MLFIHRFWVVRLYGYKGLAVFIQHTRMTIKPINLMTLFN